MLNGYALRIFHITIMVNWQNRVNVIVLMFKICVRSFDQWMTALVLSHYFIVEM